MEIFLTFLVLYLRDVLRASSLISGLTIAIGIAGGFLGLLASLIALGSATVFFLLLAPGSKQNANSM